MLDYKERRTVGAESIADNETRIKLIATLMCFISIPSSYRKAI